MADFNSLPKKVSDMNEKQLLHLILCNQIYILQKFEKVYNYLKKGKHDPKDLVPFRQKEEVIDTLMYHTWDAAVGIREYESKIDKEIEEAENE